MQDFEVFVTLEADPATGLVLLADHARNALPEPYGSLGLDDAVFRRHIAYDIGVEALTRALSERLQAPACMAGFSRLLIDPNRGEDDPTLIMKLSDGAIIPANHPLAATETAKRIATFYRPYHEAIATMLTAVEAASGKPPLVVSLHSYTPFWKGVARPWHAGILWDSDARAVRPVIDGLAAIDGLVVGDNEPYDGALKGDTLYRHCLQQGLAHVLIEVRQDLIADADGVALWADRLAPILRAMNADPALHERVIHPSRTGPYPA